MIWLPAIVTLICMGVAARVLRDSRSDPYGLTWVVAALLTIFVLVAWLIWALLT